MMFSAANHSRVNHRTAFVCGAVVVLLTFVGSTSSAAAGGRWDVCREGCRYQQIGPALAAAGDGDTIRVGPGIYTAGLTITASVTLVGAGRHSTIIRGGGPVLTIGSFGAATQPTVALRGLTITGGTTRTSPVSIPLRGAAGVIAAGGGIEIPPGTDFGPEQNPRFGPGATVSITDSSIIGNRVAPTTTAPSRIAVCPTGPCPFASALGGGIDSWGTLAIDRTVVSHNRVGTSSGLSVLASDVEGGAIQHNAGDLTISNSSFEDNVASASSPNGRFADGGAIFAAGRSVTLNDDVFRSNKAILAAGLPDTVQMVAQAGALHLGEELSAATIVDTEFFNNTARMTNTAGKTYANSGAVHSNVTLTLARDIFSRNSVVSITLPGSPGTAAGDAGAGEVSGDISDTRFVGNSVTVRSASGDALAGGGGPLFSGTMTRSLIKDNRVIAASPFGRVEVDGAGLEAGDYELALKNTKVTGNIGIATGSSGSARGGGIFNAQATGGPPGGPLQLLSSYVTGNKVFGGPGVAASGGGVFSTHPVELAESVVVRNWPDQCVGC